MYPRKLLVLYDEWRNFAELNKKNVWLDSKI